MVDYSGLNSLGLGFMQDEASTLRATRVLAPSYYGHGLSLAHCDGTEICHDSNSKSTLWLKMERTKPSIN